MTAPQLLRTCLRCLQDVPCSGGPEFWAANHPNLAMAVRGSGREIQCAGSREKTAAHPVMR